MHQPFVSANAVLIGSGVFAAFESRMFLRLIITKNKLMYVMVIG